MRLCSSCKEPKPLDQFPTQKLKSGKVYPHSRCRECRHTQCREWAKTAGGKAVKRNGILRRAYGITAEEYSRMSEIQNHVCVICSQPETKTHRDGKRLELSVDHCHTTGAVRGLLCSSCNVGLGAFYDNPEALRKAADYLIGQAKKHEEKHEPKASEQLQLPLLVQT